MTAPWIGRRLRVVRWTAVGAAVAMAACGNGRSILDAGNEAATTTTSVTTVPATAAPGDTLPPTTSTAAATTTTTPLDTLPPCPVDALAGADGPVEITFWHAMGNEVEEALVELTDEYNASQSKVRVTLQAQGGYKENIEKYLQSSQSSRPHIVQLPEYVVQQVADTDSVVPVGACVMASGFDTSEFVPRILSSFAASGVQWSMPFNVSGPVLYYNKKLFRDAGLDPEVPPETLEELRTASQAIVDSGVASTGIALDSGQDSGGGWFLEQWFAKAGVPYADNGNGRLAPATKVLFDGTKGVELLGYVQQMIQDGIAVTVGDNPRGQDALLRMANPTEQAAMAIASSAGLGTVVAVVDQGLIPDITSADIGVGPMPGPGPGVNVGGASLYIVADKGDAATAASWEYIQFLVSADAQSRWAAQTGYVPVRDDALDLNPLKRTYETDPRFKVAYTQLVEGKDDPLHSGPVIGPLREVRSVTSRAVASILGGADVAQSLTDAATQANALLADYAARN